jgi:hypothetical protein
VRLTQTTIPSLQVITDEAFWYSYLNAQEARASKARTTQAVGINSGKSILFRKILKRLGQ